MRKVDAVHLKGWYRYVFRLTGVGGAIWEEKVEKKSANNFFWKTFVKLKRDFGSSTALKLQDFLISSKLKYCFVLFLHTFLKPAGSEIFEVSWKSFSIAPFRKNSFLSCSLKKKQMRRKLTSKACKRKHRRFIGRPVSLLDTKVRALSTPKMESPQGLHRITRFIEHFYLEMQKKHNKSRAIIAIRRRWERAKNYNPRRRKTSNIREPAVGCACVCVWVALLLLFLWPCAISFLRAIQPSPNENHLRFVHALPLDGNKK